MEKNKQKNQERTINEKIWKILIFCFISFMIGAWVGFQVGFVSGARLVLEKALNFLEEQGIVRGIDLNQLQNELLKCWSKVHIVLKGGF